MKKEEEDNFGKKSKKNENKGKNKHVGKVKAGFSTDSILKNKFDKDNFGKKTCGKTL